MPPPGGCRAGGIETTTDMKFYSIKSTFLVTGLSLALGALPLGATLRAQSPATEPGKLNAADPGGTVKLTEDEVEFVTEAGGGNSAEVQLAQLALKNGENAAVKAFAQMMIKDHTTANEDLALVVRNHNITFPPPVPAEEKAVYDQMTGLKGAAFDKAYIDHAVEDHTKDVAEYQEAMDEVKDAKLKAYVEKVLPIVAGHLKEARSIQAKLGGS